MKCLDSVRIIFALNVRRDTEAHFALSVNCQSPHRDI